MYESAAERCRRSMENRVKQQRKRSVEESQGVCRSASGVFEVGRLETGYGGQLRMEVFARGIVGATNLFTNDCMTRPGRASVQD